MKNKNRLYYCFFGIVFFLFTMFFGLVYRAARFDKQIKNGTESKSEIQIQSREIEVVYIDTPRIECYNPPIYLTEDEQWVVECMVAGAAAWETYEGKLAVTQCIFDAMIKDGLTAREVREKYQYIGWNDNLYKQNRGMYIEVLNAIKDIFYGGKFVTDKPILYFYNPAIVYSSFHESLNYAMTIGGHKFFYLTEDENAEWTNILLTKVNEYDIIEPQVMIMYVLYNQKYYLMHNAIGQWIPTTELNESFQFNDKTKADNALANLPKQMRNLGYFVQQIDAPSKPVDFDQFNNSNLVNYDSALAQIGSFCDLHDQLVARATWIEYKLQEVENKIQDVLHAIEFNSYNARDGYKIYKLLHDLRLERRKYKDEQIIADVMKSGFANSNWELTRSRVDDLKDRQYNVREMEELFK